MESEFELHSFLISTVMSNKNYHVYLNENFFKSKTYIKSLIIFGLNISEQQIEVQKRHQ